MSEHELAERADAYAESDALAYGYRPPSEAVEWAAWGEEPEPWISTEGINSRADAEAYTRKYGGTVAMRTVTEWRDVR
jgi:hypothetical protein